MKSLDIILEVAQQNNIKLNKNNLDATLKEIGIDSLATMDLIIKIEEKINVQLDDNILMEIKTLKQLANAFDNAKK